jgi:CubicO group peptidase (beta-lactamase class C family)
MTPHAIRVSLLGLSMLAATPSAWARQPDTVAPASDPSGYQRAADYSAGVGGRAALVLLDGVPIFERYDREWKDNRPHPLASGTKSFAGVVAAAAVEDGLLAWDELACDTIAQWKDHPLKSRITVRHLLNLSSGLDPAEEILQGSFGPLRRPGTRERSTERLAADRFEASLDVKMNHAPGTRFEYGPSHFYAFGALLERKIKARREQDPTFPDDSYESYMKRRVLEPVGLSFAARGRTEGSFWGRDRAGNLNLPGGAGLTAAQWARFGEFIRHQGAVEQPDGTMKQVIGWQFLDECFKPSEANKGYGLTWWLPTNSMDEDDSTQPAVGGGTLQERLTRRARERALEREAAAKHPAFLDDEGKPIDVYMAAGLGKQRLFVVPSLKLTVVRLGENVAASSRFSNADFLGPIVEEAKAAAK